MSQWTQEDVDRIRKQHGVMMPANVPKPQKSKYRNVRTTIGTQVFDSKREADYWLLLKARVELGEIDRLERQVAFDLRCKAHNQPGVELTVAVYVADFCYFDKSENLHVVDAKGKRTREYALKAKWLELQDGIVIEEV
jgi:hypothetical protein